MWAPSPSITPIFTPFISQKLHVSPSNKYCRHYLPNGNPWARTKSGYHPLELYRYLVPFSAIKWKEAVTDNWCKNMILTKHSQKREGQQRYRLLGCTGNSQHYEGITKDASALTLFISKNFTILCSPDRPFHMCEDLLPLCFLHRLYQAIL